MEDLKLRKESAKKALNLINAKELLIQDELLVISLLDENNPTPMPQQKADAGKICLDALREFFEKEANAEK